VRSGFEVKLLAHEQELYVLAKSQPRIDKERAMPSAQSAPQTAPRTAPDEIYQQPNLATQTRVPDVRVQHYSLSITHDRSNSAIFLHSGPSHFHKFSLFSINYLSKTGQCQLCASVCLQWRSGCSKSRKIRSRVEPATYRLRKILSRLVISRNLEKVRKNKGHEPRMHRFLWFSRVGVETTWKQSLRL
jgi:hypothetical protein